MKRAFILLGILAAILIFQPINTVKADDWVHEVVDDNYIHNWYYLMDIDSNGKPQILYQLKNTETNTYKLIYAYKNNDLFDKCVIDEYDYLTHFSFTIDNSDKLHIAYAKYDSIVYATVTANICSSLQKNPYFISDMYLGNQLDITLTNSDTPTIVYNSGFSDYLTYGEIIGSSLSNVKDIELDVDDCHSPHSLLVDQFNNPHFLSPCYNGLNHIYKDGDSWKTINFFSGSLGSMIKSSTNKLYLAYNCDAPEEIVYATWNGSEWQEDKTGIYMMSSDDLSLDIDSHGYPHIVFDPTATGYSRGYIYYNGTSWQEPEIICNDCYRSIQEFSLDPSDKPHVVYATKNNELKYAYKTSVVTPTIAQSPMSGPPGTTFTQSGAGFTSNSTATLHFKKPDGSEYPTQNISIDSEGDFNFFYTAPLNKPVGAYTWWAVNNQSSVNSNEISYEITSETAANDNKMVLYSIGTYDSTVDPGYMNTSKAAQYIVSGFDCFSQKLGYTFKYELFTKDVNQNKTCADILNKIRTQAIYLNSNDIFVFVFTGHGLIDLLHFGDKGCTITATELYSALLEVSKNHPRILAIISACHSSSFKNELSKLKKIHISTSVKNDDELAYANLYSDLGWVPIHTYEILDKMNCIPEKEDILMSYRSIQDEIKQIFIALLDPSNISDIIGHTVIDMNNETEAIMTEEMWNPLYTEGVNPSSVTPILPILLVD